VLVILRMSVQRADPLIFVTPTVPLPPTTSQGCQWPPALKNTVARCGEVVYCLFDIEQEKRPFISIASLKKINHMCL